MAARSIIVTGGFGTLGRAVAGAFARNGDKVLRVDFAASSAEALPGVLDLGQIDLTDPAQCARALELARSEHGGLDVLVNVAGGFVWETVGPDAAPTWQRMFAMNVATAVTMTSAALPDLGRSAAGRVVNIGANAAIQSVTGMGAYAASKAGVHRFTETLADELRSSGTTVNAILPSIIDTPANRADMPEADTSSWVKPQAIADVILFLASDAARSITGALIPVTRGTSF